MSDERAKEVRIESVDNGFVLVTYPTHQSVRSGDMIGTHTVHETFASLVEELRERFGEGGNRCLGVHIPSGYNCELRVGHIGQHSALTGARVWGQS